MFIFNTIYIAFQATIVASFITLWLAISNPDHLVIDDNAYQRLNSDLKAQEPVQDSEKGDSN